MSQIYFRREKNIYRKSRISVKCQLHFMNDQSTTQLSLGKEEKLKNQGVK